MSLAEQLVSRVLSIEARLDMLEGGSVVPERLSLERLLTLRAQGSVASTALQMVLLPWCVHPHPDKDSDAHYSRRSDSYGGSWPIHVTQKKSGESFRLRVYSHMNTDINMSLNTSDADEAMSRADGVLAVAGFRLENTQ